MAEAEAVVVERLGAIARVTVDRPEARNAINTALIVDLTHIFGELATESAVRAVILTGAGDRAFISGADIREMSAKTPAEGREFSRLGHRLTALIEEMDRVVIAAINGAALGGGCEIAIACDLRVASQGARLGQPEVRLGIIPGWGATFRLPRLVGEGVAREMILAGRTYSAEEALRVGLVNAVVPPHMLMPEAMKLAGEIVSAGPLAVAAAKHSMRLTRHLERAPAADLEGDLFAQGFSTEDQKEGMGAFLARREPDFKGR